MNWIGFLALLFFLIGWLCGVVAWLYTALHIFRAWFTVDGWNGFNENGRKAFRGGWAFIICCAFGLCNGLIGAWLGGWQNLPMPHP